jgi:DNA adenine methylase
MSEQLAMFNMYEHNLDKALINVASVPQRSPFRYPGGKTWLIPVVRKWLRQEGKSVESLFEPFVGGGIVSLTAAFERMAENIFMYEIDDEISAVWYSILNGKNKWLADKILTFNLTSDNVKVELNNPKKELQDIAFCTILKNRVYHGGILAKGSGMIKNGENGKGITSRWYPRTLHDRIVAIGHYKEKIFFSSGDAFDVLEQNKDDVNAYFFIDPPYTVAGKRLYTHFEIDHEKLFMLTARIKGKYMLTYDNTPEIRQLADKYNLQYRTIPMKTTLHYEKHEIIISDNFNWW